LYKLHPEKPTEVAFRLIQGIDPIATVIATTHTRPYADKLSEIANTDSFLNKFVYASGYDAN